MSDERPETPGLDPAQAEQVVEFLEAIVEDRGVLADLDTDLIRRLMTAAGRASRPTKGEQRSSTGSIAAGAETHGGRRTRRSWTPLASARSGASRYS